MLLRQIYFSGNYLNDLSHVVFNNTTYINILSLANNAITSFRLEVFQPLNSLKYLNISYNNINITDIDFISENKLKLNSLDLSWNNLSNIHGVLRTFDIIHFDTVYLTGNNFGIIDLYEDWNCHLYLQPNRLHIPRLGKLYLDHCNIKYINTNSFLSIPTLEFADLSHNLLTYVDDLVRLSNKVSVDIIKT